MNLQNLIKQFSNLSNLGGLGNFNIQNNQGNNQPQATQNGQSELYPESFNTNEFYSSNNNPQNSQYNNYLNRENYNSFNNGYNNNNSGNYNQNQNRNSSGGFLNGLLGPNANITSLLPFLSLFNGKSGINSLLKSDSLPDSFKKLAPFISLLSSTAEDKSNNSDIIKIDKLKKIDND